MDADGNGPAALALPACAAAGGSAATGVIVGGLSRMLTDRSLDEVVELVGAVLPFTPAAAAVALLVAWRGTRPSESDGELPSAGAVAIGMVMGPAVGAAVGVGLFVTVASVLAAALGGPTAAEVSNSTWAARGPAPAIAAAATAGVLGLTLALLDRRTARGS